MADVEMTDAAPAVKSGKAVAESSEKKPRFEVKKVRTSTASSIVVLTELMLDYSGTQSLYGRGTSSSTTVPSAATTSWISASIAKLIRPLRHLRNAPSPGGSVM